MSVTPARRLVLIAAAVVVVGVALGVSLAASSSPSKKATAPPSGSGHVRATAPTVPATFEPTSATSASATYLAPEVAYTVELTSTSGPCWVMATDPATGAVVWTGTLAAGESRPLAATGGLLVRLGAAYHVTVTLNGEPVDFPPGYESPFDLTFAT